MNWKIFLFSVAVALTVSSCAHKSGHRQNDWSQRNIDSTDVVNGRNTPAAKEDDRDLSVEYSDVRGEKYKMDGPEIFQKYNTAVFMVFTSDGFSGYQGSGFFINSDGLAVSNYHVFQGTNIGEEEIKLADSDKVYKVYEVLVKSEEEDFILFRVNATNTNYLPLAKTQPRVGERVYAIGSPRGLENTFSSGEVSQWRATNLMQISALIDHGSSGGALINEYGEAVGITAGTFADGSQANLNYAWSVDILKPYFK